MYLIDDYVKVCKLFCKHTAFVHSSQIF